jgi:hypothetical protein
MSHDLVLHSTPDLERKLSVTFKKRACELITQHTAHVVLPLLEKLPSAVT